MIYTIYMDVDSALRRENEPPFSSCSLVGPEEKERQKARRLGGIVPESLRSVNRSSDNGRCSRFAATRVLQSVCGLFRTPSILFDRRKAGLMLDSSQLWRRNDCAATREGSPPPLREGFSALSSRSPRCRQPRWLRLSASGMTALFAWMVLLATPAQALAHPALTPQHRDGIRLLPSAEMTRMVGAQSTGHPLSISPQASSTFPWEGSVGGTNTGNGNKLTQIPLVGWTQRGGLPVGLTLAHNSQSSHSGELGPKWTHCFDVYLTAVSGGATTDDGPPPPSYSVHWGDDLSYTFANNGSNVFSPPTGIYDTLVQNVDGTYTLTTKGQVKYHFNTSLYCDTITDSNAMLSPSATTRATT